MCLRKDIGDLDTRDLTLLYTAFNSIVGRGNILRWIWDDLWKDEVLSDGVAIAKHAFEYFEPMYARITMKDKQVRYEEQQKLAEHMRLIEN